MAGTPTAGSGHAGRREWPSATSAAFRSALARGIGLALLTIGLGSALAALDRWGGFGMGLGAAVLIGLWQWRASRDAVHGVFCVLTSGALVMAMMSSSAILWGDWRFGLAGMGLITTCCLILFVGQAALAIDPDARSADHGRGADTGFSDQHRAMRAPFRR